MKRRDWQSVQSLGISMMIGGTLLIVLLLATSEDAIVSASVNQTQHPVLHLTQQSSQVPLCRFGVDATDDISDYNIAPLQLGWYVNWTASSSPPQPNGIRYVPTIRLTQVGTDSYTYAPSGIELQQAITNTPGADWLIGNEPDRPGPYQDDSMPEVYARAYHELYYLIKAADPTARVFAGGIVQATEIRLQYLDLVLSSYQELYGEPLPADGWNIHGFVLNEVDPEYYPDMNWGAGIPSGVNVTHGEILAIGDNDNFELFKERIERFRQWMADRGYRGLPVYLSEFGVQMPPDYDLPTGFPPERVNAFMTKTFDYLRTETDPLLGDPNDGYRLVQRWAWWSLTDTFSNGWLFDPTTHARTAIGDHWGAYTTLLSPTIDLYPAHIFAQPAAPFSQGENVTFTLKAVIANSGNISSTYPITVHFYDGNPAEGGVQIGSEQVVAPLLGCGGNRIAEVEWSNVPSGTHSVYVSVDPTGVISESNELNNIAEQTILVATHRSFLPRAGKGFSN